MKSFKLAFHSAFDFVQLRFLVVGLALAIVYLAEPIQVRGQNAPDPSKWVDAVRNLLSQDADVLNQSEKMLRAALATSNRTEEMACGLVLLQLIHGDVAQVDFVLRAIPAAFPQPSEATRRFAVRVRIWQVLSQSDTTALGPLVDGLVQQTLSDETSIDDKRLNAAMLGTLVEMLKPDAAKSSLAQTQLDEIRQKISSCRDRNVTNAFESARQEAMSRAKILAETTAHVQLIGIEAAERERQDLRQQLVSRGLVVEDAKLTARELIRNAREIAKQNIRDQRDLNGKLTQVTVKENTPTPGHPGIPPVEPRIPQKSQIRVDEYEEVRTGYETKTDSSGNKVRVPQYERRRRDSSDIEREKSDIFNRLMTDYRVAKSLYDERKGVYDNALMTWQNFDKQRRIGLANEREELLAKKKELDDAARTVQANREEATKNANSQKSELEQLIEEFEALEIAVEAVKADRIAEIFRAGNFPVFQIPQEHARLLKLAKSSKKTS